MYSAKIINPGNEEWCSFQWLICVTNPLTSLKNSCSTMTSLLVTCKQYSLIADEGLTTMYTEYEGRKSVNLWIKV